MCLEITFFTFMYVVLGLNQKIMFPEPIWPNKRVTVVKIQEEKKNEVMRRPIYILSLLCISLFCLSSSSGCSSPRRC